MNVSTEAGGIRVDVGTIGAETSLPTGLFVLSSNGVSVVDSSVNLMSSTLSNFSSFDTTLTFPSKKVMDRQTTILSPLSELAYSPRQV